MGKVEARTDEEQPRHEESARDEAETPEFDVGELDAEELKQLLDEVRASDELELAQNRGSAPENDAAKGASAGETESTEQDELLDEARASEGEESGIVGTDRKRDEKEPTPEESEQSWDDVESERKEKAIAEPAGDHEPTPEPEPAELDELLDEAAAGSDDERADAATEVDKDEPTEAPAAKQLAEADVREPETAAKEQAKADAKEPAESAAKEPAEREEPTVSRAAEQFSEPPPPPKRTSKGPAASATGTPLPHWSQRPLPHPPRPEHPPESPGLDAMEVSLPDDPELPSFDSIPAPLGDASPPAGESTEPAAEALESMPPPRPARGNSGTVAIALLLGVVAGAFGMRAFDLVEQRRGVEALLSPAAPDEAEPATAKHDPASAAAAATKSGPTEVSSASPAAQPREIAFGPYVAGPPPTASDKDETEEPEEPEAEPEPPPEFDKAAAAAALSLGAVRASTCRVAGAPKGFARVRVTFKSDGRAINAIVVGPPYAGTATGSCIARTMRSVTVPPFSGDSQTVSKTVEIK